MVLKSASYSWTILSFVTYATLNFCIIQCRLLVQHMRGLRALNGVIMNIVFTADSFHKQQYNVHNEYPMGKRLLSP